VDNTVEHFVKVIKKEGKSHKLVEAKTVARPWWTDRSGGLDVSAVIKVS
jgi:hypothetical protein